MNLTETLAYAEQILAKQGNRSRYARAVLRGAQNWSGSDLAGAAKRWGSSYAKQRAAARDALELAGGNVIAVDHGRLMSAISVGSDDYGRVIWETADGPAIQISARQARMLR